jgi:nucleotide-binding universal stress UspA family protein
MSTVLAAVDAEEVARHVVDTALELARLIGADVELLHVVERPADLDAVAERFAGLRLRAATGDPSERIIDASQDDAVSLVVVGARTTQGGARPAGHVARAIVERADKPVVVVPPATPGRSTTIRRALVPLEGSEASTACVAEPLEALAAAGVHLVPIHVFDLDTSPSFWDHAAHSHDSFATSFARRWCAPAADRLRLRRGPAGDAVVAAARDDDIDLIVLGWSRHLAAGRAPVVRTVLAEARVPVLLVPVRPDPTP